MLCTYLLVGEQVYSDGSADDLITLCFITLYKLFKNFISDDVEDDGHLLHVTSNDGDLHHDPQDEVWYLGSISSSLMNQLKNISANKRAIF